ncbi:hypothetical protein [Streptomyces sp. NBC_00354]|uniref:hypothetical protein n=1 Tax=Streptomyces sp. NBC_00354 TaxID=2975723 RepID=UPI002E2526E7|nr:hypothetical protein OG296_07900 [Streptomyces sp. NBC_01001]
MSTGKWLLVSLRRYVLTASLGWAGAAALLPRLDEDSFGGTFAVGMATGLVGVPLLTIATMLVITLLAQRRYEPPTGGVERIRGGWMVVLPLAPLLPVALLMPLQYLIIVGTQIVYVLGVLPCQDSRDTADVLHSLADRAVPAAHRARIARAVAGLGTRPVREALVNASADEEPEVAEAALETLCTIWQRSGVVDEDLLLKMHPQAQDRVRALGVEVRSPR